MKKIISLAVCVSFLFVSCSQSQVFPEQMLPNDAQREQIAQVPKYFDGRDFSDGVAWMRDRGGQWHCVDKTGSIVLKLIEREAPKSDFSHGVALVTRADGTVELIDKTGKVISSPKSGEYDEIRAFIHDIGMILVYKHVETFEVTENRAGVIDNKGNWKVALINNFVLVTATKIGRKGFPEVILQDKCNISEWKEPYTYKYVLWNCGEGIFRCRKDAPYEDTYFYNILTGHTGKLPMPTKFENGVGVFAARVKTSGYASIVYKVDKTGEATAIITPSRDYMIFNYGLGEYSDGLFYFYSDEKSPGFYDITGKQIVDLSGYKLDQADQHKFSDGYCVLNLRNPQGSSYFTVIDKSGKKMFEPKPIPEPGYKQNKWGESYKPGRWLSTSCGMIVIDDDDNNQFSVTSASGEAVFTLTKRDGSVSNYSEDVALVKGKGEVYYIDKTGKRLF